MALLTVQVPVAGGSVVTLSAAGASGDEWPVRGTEMLVVDNAGASPVTVTFECYKPCDVGGILHPIVQTVAAGAREYFPPISAYHMDPVNRTAKVTYSATASVTVAVVSPK